jgi:hypothetical protein
VRINARLWRLDWLGLMWAALLIGLVLVPTAATTLAGGLLAVAEKGVAMRAELDAVV